MASRSLGYDALDRLTVANSPNVWGNASYDYDPLDNLRTSGVGSRSTSHGYDGAHRLSQVVTNGVASAYGYDAQGNIIRKGNRGYLFDQGNRLLASGSSSYAYDGLGRRTAITGSDGKRRVQVYSQGGQLLYGRLTPAPGSSTPSSAIRYVYLGGQAIAETDSAGTTHLHTDALGSPVARTNASGQLLSRTRYEPYGATAAGSNPGANPGTGIDNLGYTGHANDPETGLVYMQQRYYDPVAGRFLSVDPVVTSAHSGRGFNRYKYANNSPYNYTDPDGRIETVQLPTQYISARRESNPFYSPVQSSSAGQERWRATAVGAGMVAGGFVGNAAAGWCAFSTGGVCAAGWSGIVGLGVAGGGLLGTGFYNLAEWVVVLATGANSEGGERIRGLPPEGVAPPVEGEVKPGPASRPSERDKGGQSLWDDKRGEWRYSPEDKWHNPHWDYNPHDKPSSPWQNVPIGPLPPRK